MAVQHRRPGKHGVLVSNVCLGTMNFGWHTSEEDSFRIMDRALELGINFFDTLVRQGRVELDVIPACRHYGLGLIPWSPLGGGLLGGAPEKHDTGRRTDEEFSRRVAEKRGQLEQYEDLCLSLIHI